MEQGDTIESLEDLAEECHRIAERIHRYAEMEKHNLGYSHVGMLSVATFCEWVARDIRQRATLANHAGETAETRKQFDERGGLRMPEVQESQESQESRAQNKEEEQGEKSR